MWLADFLFGAKKFKFTSLPKDDPPDGSMQFASWPAPPYELLPSNFLYYEFGPNCGESDPVAIELGKQIIEALCRSRQVLTVVRAHKEFHRGHQIPPLRIDRYIETLQKEQPMISVCRVNELKLAYLSTGYDQKILPTYYTSPTGATCDFSFYLFPETKHLLDAKCALERVAAHQYELKLAYVDHGPTALEMYMNQNAVDIQCVRNVVEKICAQNSVPLINPPTTEQL